MFSQTRASGGKRNALFFLVHNFPLLTISFLVMLAPLTGSFSGQMAAAPQVAWPSLTLVPYASGLSAPTAIVNAGDGSGRLFVVEQPGIIRILKNGALQPIPFLDISSLVLNSGEEGLLGLAFSPNYSQNGQFFIYYTQFDMSNVLASFSISSNPDQADANSEQKLLVIPHPDASNHNGGQLAFGPDGYLYVGIGDGGGGGDPNGNAQNTSVMAGKILRIQPNLSPITGRHVDPPSNGNLIYLPSIQTEVFPGLNYGIPSTNPFWSSYPAALPEIWAYGLRNPWRFCFDIQTGDLYIADVGQDAMEEIDFQVAGSAGGQNYGWNIMEGNLCYPSGNPSSDCTQPSGYVAPVATYLHGSNDSYGCAVIGGYVYRGQTYPSLQGIYLYGDYCSGRIWGLVQEGGSWQTQELLHTSLSITTFGQGEDGTLYVADGHTGNIYKITAP